MKILLPDESTVETTNNYIASATVGSMIMLKISDEVLPFKVVKKEVDLITVEPFKPKDPPPQPLPKLDKNDKGDDKVSPKMSARGFGWY